MTVGIDCDGVVRNLMMGAYKAIRDLRPDMLGHLHDEPHDPPEYDMEGMMHTYDPDIAGTLNRLVFGGGEVTRAAYTGAPMTRDARDGTVQRVVHRLREDAGASVYVCTKQPTVEQRRCTLEWLDAFDVPFDGLILTDGDKGQFGLDWLVDDRYRHILEMARSGAKGVLVKRRHNRFDRKRCARVVSGLEEFADLVCADA